jgi:hypothetical protein
LTKSIDSRRSQTQVFRTHILWQVLHVGHLMMNCNLLAEREIENEQKHDAAPTTKKIDPIRFDSI